MRVLILGGDGYLGWPTAMHFSASGDNVWVADNFAKRKWELEEGITPLLVIPTLHNRVKRWKEVKGNSIQVRIGDLNNHRFVYKLFDEVKPETIIHYAEQPSAPYSMQNRNTTVITQMNNIVGTLNVLFAIRRYCPDAHLVKLGTMGEYGTPNIDIEEGYIEITHNGRKDVVLYPKKPGSFYHLSKVHDSHNIYFACNVWGLRATDLNQGVVYGISTDHTELDRDLRTSFHYDHVFGTVLNRFIVQAASDYPLTVYGKGEQTRGFLNLRDTIQCVELAARHPAIRGEYRVFNQFTEQLSVNQLAEKVKRVGSSIGLDVKVNHVNNPRKELEEHYYNAKHAKLVELGLKPHFLTDDVLRAMLLSVMSNREYVDTSQFAPRIHWVGGQEQEN